MQHTMQELIEAAKERGFNPTPRMVQDWIELGLTRSARASRARARERCQRHVVRAAAGALLLFA